MLILGIFGTVTELVLLEHYEKPIQLVPVILLAIGILVIAWHAMKHDSISRQALVIVMVLFVLAGFAGFVAHFIGSAEFQLELDPSMSTWDLIEKVLRAKAPPLLAPGMMLQLGLLGLAYISFAATHKKSVAIGGGADMDDCAAMAVGLEPERGAEVGAGDAALGYEPDERHGGIC